jgi:hypothetical protein
MPPARRKARRARPPRSHEPPRIRAVEERGLPLVKELARVARLPDPPVTRLEGALEILFGALGRGDDRFAGLLLEGWLRARRDKRYRLTLAWLREQIRLSLEEILRDGVALGAFRADLDPVLFSALCLAAAEGALLHAPTEGGSAPPDALVRSLLGLAGA